MKEPIRLSSFRTPASVRRALTPAGSPALPILAILAPLIVATYAVKPEAAGRPAAHATASEVLLLEGAAERLAGSIRIPTISHASTDASDADAFAAFHAYLEDAFPRAHGELRREVVAEHSLLYTWPGSNSSLRPILLMGHMDVVPVEERTRGEWREDPFGGRIADGFVWGRGAIDNKSAVVGTLEAVELLLSEGFRPARTIYLAYGHDEEVGGTRGARAIAELLRRRGVRLEMVLDEGGVIGDGLLPGVESAVALVGIAEKGFLSLELSTRAPGGHSSLPPRESAIGILGAAVARLERHPMPAKLEGATSQMFDRVAPLFPPAQRIALANLWLTRPLVLRSLTGSPATNAMVRTTAATTIFEAGTKDNVLPSRARAVVNFRILPGDSIAGVEEHVRRVIDDPRVEVGHAGAFTAEPSTVSRTGSQAYRRLEQAIRSVAPEVTVAPYLVVVATDARYYADLADDVYRFLPVRLEPRDLERMHGIDERIAIRDYERAVRIYRQLILDTGMSS